MRFCFPALLLVSLLVVGCSGKTEMVSNHPNGMIEGRGYVDSNGEKTGDWLEWDEKGQKVSGKTYKNGNCLEETHIRWNEHGFKISEAAWTFLKSEKTYKNGEMPGKRAKGIITYFGGDGEVDVVRDIEVKWLKDGSMHEQTEYRGDIKDGNDWVFFPGGAYWLTKWISGEKDTRTECRSDGQPSIFIKYNDGVEERMSRALYHDNGNTKVSYSVAFPEGHSYDWAFERGWYGRDKSEGIKGFDLTDRPTAPATKGVLDGQLRKYYENGEIKLIYRYENGVRDGIQSEFDEDGNVTATVQYRDGEKV